MSKITIEQVEKLQQRANVTYEEAKDALEKNDGDILEALIQLEKDGKTTQPGGGAYSTNGQTGSDPGYNNNQGSSGQNNQYNQNQNQNNYNQSGPNMNYNQRPRQESDFSKQAKSVWRSFLDLLHKGNINHFVVSKHDNEVIRMPINILIILLIIFNGAALIALIIFLFLGFKYSFDGPNLGKDSINNVMNSASDTAENIKENVKNSTAGDQNNDPNNNPNNDPNNGQNNNQ